MAATTFGLLTQNYRSSTGIGSSYRSAGLGSSIRAQGKYDAEINRALNIGNNSRIGYGSAFKNDARLRNKYYSSLGTTETKKKTNTTGLIVGAAGGALSGAAAGSVINTPYGTIIGAILGAVSGGVAGANS